MTTALMPHDEVLDGLPIRSVLEDLAGFRQLVVVTDPVGRIVWVRDGLELICGDLEQLIGRDCREILPIQGLLEADFAQTDVTVQIPGRDNTTVSMDIDAFPVGGSGPASNLTVVIFRPSADRERHRRGQPDNSGYLRALLDSAPDAVVTVDRAGFINYANAAVTRIFGVAPESLIDRPVALFVQNVVSLNRVVSGLQPNGDMSDEEIQIRRYDGKEVWISVSSRALDLGDGETAGRVAFLRDITERKRAEEQVERKNEELENYVHSVSHDLRSPLVSLLGFSGLLRQDYGRILDSTGRHFIERIEQAGRTMEALIHDLLELSRIGRTNEVRELVDPRSVLIQIQSEFKLRMEEVGIVLELPAHPPMLFCDRTRLYQIFSNLIGNAVMHMGTCASPTIRVEIREEADHHHISVADNGRGIPEDSHERVFEVFKTLAGCSDGTRSTGVGLAIVKKIIESQSGAIWVDSKPGSGAAFHLTLPKS